MHLKYWATGVALGLIGCASTLSVEPGSESAVTTGPEVTTDNAEGRRSSEQREESRIQQEDASGRLANKTTVNRVPTLFGAFGSDVSKPDAVTGLFRSNYGPTPD